MKVPMDAFYGSIFQNACINYNFFLNGSFEHSYNVQKSSKTFLEVLAGME